MHHSSYLYNLVTMAAQHKSQRHIPYVLLATSSCHDWEILSAMPDINLYVYMVI